MISTPSTQAVIFSQLHGIIVEHLGVKVEDVTLDARFEEDLGADSLDMVELVMAIEEHFGIAEVEDTDRERIHTVRDAVIYIDHAPIR